MAKRGRKPGQLGKCSVCGQLGHNKATCPVSKQNSKPSKPTAKPSKPTAKPAKKVKVSKTSKPTAKPTKKAVVPATSAPAPKVNSKPVAPVIINGKAASGDEAFDLNRYVAAMLASEPFFAGMSRCINKRSSKAIPTAGVCVNPTTYQYDLLYNPDFMNKLNPIERRGVLLHEYYHLALDHCTTRVAALNIKENKAKLYQWNIAADLAINSHLKEQLPDFCCMPGNGPFTEYPAGLTAEDYYARLEKDEEFQKKAEQQNGEGQQGQGDPSEGGGSGQPSDQFDSHDGWGKDENGNPVDGAVGDIAREKMREGMRKAVQEAAQQSSWGTMSQEMRDWLVKNLQSRIDWKKALRYFVRTSQRAAKSSSIRHINKRYPYIHAGKKVNRQANVAICIDQSGSVSDELLSKFFGELNKLSELATFTVVPFDHEVCESKIYVWKRGQHRATERVLCGGTCFDAPTDWVNKASRFDGMIILTDMEAPQPKRAQCQRMWMTDIHHAASEHGLNPANGEKVIAIPE